MFDVHSALFFRACQVEKLEQLAQVFKVLDHMSYFLSSSSLGARYSPVGDFLALFSSNER